jgi:hypothetical protein
MFKKLVPVLALALIAGPAFAADTPPAPAGDQAATAPAKTHHKKHHKKSHKSTTSSTDSSGAK